MAKYKRKLFFDLKATGWFLERQPLKCGTKEKLEKGHYNIVFAHPEFIVSSKDGRKLMQSKPYQENVCAVVIDEAHCILEW